MVDTYTLRNLAMFLYPLYGYFIYRHYHWQRLTPFIAVVFLSLTLSNAIAHNLNRAFSIKKLIHVYQYKKHEEESSMYLPKKIDPAGVGSSTKGFGEGDRSDNMVFRILIWQDMVQEMVNKKAWFGMGLSHPLRSKQIEELHWAETEWSKDGWISAHNSYLYVIYRIGVFGLVCIVWLLMAFYCKFKEAVAQRNATGIILCLCFSYWLLRALTGEQFQLPYNAIPMWVVFGLIMKGRHDNH